MASLEAEFLGGKGRKGWRVEGNGFDESKSLLDAQSFMGVKSRKQLSCELLVVSRGLFWAAAAGCRWGWRGGLTACWRGKVVG